MDTTIAPPMPTRSADPVNRPTWVYHCMCSHGAELYVGVAYDLRRRLGQHKTKAPDWWGHVDGITADLYRSRPEALAVERHHLQWGGVALNNAAGTRSFPQPPFAWIARLPVAVLEDGALKLAPFWIEPDTGRAVYDQPMPVGA